MKKIIILFLLTFSFCHAQINTFYVDTTFAIFKQIDNDSTIRTGMILYRTDCLSSVSGDTPYQYAWKVFIDSMGVRREIKPVYIRYCKIYTHGK